MQYSKVSKDRRTEFGAGAAVDLRIIGIGVTLMFGPIMYGIYVDFLCVRVWAEVLRYPDYTREFA